MRDRECSCLVQKHACTKPFAHAFCSLKEPKWQRHEHSTCRNKESQFSNSFIFMCTYVHTHHGTWETMYHWVRWLQGTNLHKPCFWASHEQVAPWSIGGCGRHSAGNHWLFAREGLQWFGASSEGTQWEDDLEECTPGGLAGWFYSSTGEKASEDKPYLRFFIKKLKKAFCKVNTEWKRCNYSKQHDNDWVDQMDEQIRIACHQYRCLKKDPLSQKRFFKKASVSEAEQVQDVLGNIKWANDGTEQEPNEEQLALQKREGMYELSLEQSKPTIFKRLLKRRTHRSLNAMHILLLHPARSFLYLQLPCHLHQRLALYQPCLQMSMRSWPSGCWRALHHHLGRSQQPRRQKQKKGQTSKRRKQLQRKLPHWSAASSIERPLQLTTRPKQMPSKQGCHPIQWKKEPDQPWGKWQLTSTVGLWRKSEKRSSLHWFCLVNLLHFYCWEFGSELQFVCERNRCVFCWLVSCVGFLCSYWWEKESGRGECLWMFSVHVLC